MSLDDLRRQAIDQDLQEVEALEAALAPEPDEGKLFGMTAIERMFVSMGLFGVVLVISLLLLIVTDSIAIQ